MNKWSKFALAVLLGMGLGVHAAETGSPEQAAKTEAALMNEVKGKAARQGKTLTLNYADGKSRSFLDQTACTGFEDCIHYYLKAYYPRHGYFLLDVYRYEGGLYLLVRERDGKEEVIRGEPILSPDGAAFVSACFNDIDCNALEVYRFTERGIWREFAHAPEDYSVYKVRQWDGDNKVLLERVTYEGKKEIHDDAQLLFSEGRWTLQEP